VDNVGWVESVPNVCQFVRKLESRATESIDWAERRELEFDTAKTKEALFTGI
jgi:hypothetical protein